MVFNCCHMLGAKTSLYDRNMLTGPTGLWKVLHQGPEPVGVRHTFKYVVHADDCLQADMTLLIFKDLHHGISMFPCRVEQVVSNDYTKRGMQTRREKRMIILLVQWLKWA